MKVELKTIRCWHLFSVNRTLALCVVLGTITSASSLFGNDHEDKDKRDRQSSVQNRERDLAPDQDQDFKAKTDPEKFIRHVAQAGMKEIRLANLAKQRAQSQEVKQFAETLIQDHTQAQNELKLIAQHQNIPWAGVLDATGSAVPSSITSATIPDDRETARSKERTPAEASGTARGAGVADTSGSVAPSSIRPSTDRERTPAAANGTARGAYAPDDAGSSAYEQRDPYDQLVGFSGRSFDDAYLNHEVQCHTKAVAKFEKASNDLPDGELKQFVESTLPKLRQHLDLAKQMAPADPTRVNVRERTDRDYKK